MVRTICILFLISCSFAGFGQKKKAKKKDPVVLFELNQRKVPADEFIYLYKKNHQSKPGEYTAADINEYLDLFIKFKLKVEEARHRGMDTTAAFLSEYHTYRNELIKPHLPDNRIMDSLMVQAYDRLKEEVRASHLLIGLKADATPEDTIAAFKKISELKARAMNGEDFGLLAANFSEDPSAKSNKGDLGFFTALQMVYPFENAAYGAKVGDLVGPVRTQFGYHLIKVTDRQPARGEVEVSHIMLRAGTESEGQAVRDKAFNIHQQLMAGASWEELCRENSDDVNSRERGGRLPAFGVGAMAAVPEFERVAFSLRPGDISDPFRTAYGWHILRVERKIPLPSFEDSRSSLKNRIAGDQRFEESRHVWIRKLKEDNGYAINEAVWQRVLDRSDSVIGSNAWQPGALSDLKGEGLFTLRGEIFTTGDFATYGATQRIQAGTTAQETMGKLLDQLVEEKLLEALGNDIMVRNPEFRMLANEYYEGILLFDIMEKEVWNRATEDTAGLAAYFNRHRPAYLAGERARATIYSSPDSMVISKLKELAADDDEAATLYADNQSIRNEKGVFERGDREIFGRVSWSEGVHSAENKGMYYLAWIEQILPPGEKSLEEARASVIADYQQELENSWVRQLREKYRVKINEKAKQYVLDQLQKR